MNHIKELKRLDGVDIGYHKSNLHPKNGEGCVGKSGINKDFSLVQVIELAYKMEERPNIIIKAGQNAKWYLKKFYLDDLDSFDREIKKQSWRDTSRCKMYIIDWE